jgi:esterase
VEIFYRKLGQPGATPILIFHGGNYYDSLDWIDVALALSDDREVVSFDSRGFGESGWSQSRDYSHAAHMADAVTLLDHLGWQSVIAVGHSRGGAYALLLAARFPERTSALAIIDYCPGIGIGPRGMPIAMTQSVNNNFRMFRDAKAALASTSRFNFSPDNTKLQSRFEMLLRDEEGGVVIAKRDPDFSNQIPTSESVFSPLLVGDMWLELDRVSIPILVIRATKSKAGYAEEDLHRLRSHYPDIQVINVESGHDVVGETPNELAKAINSWLKSDFSGNFSA